MPLPVRFAARICPRRTRSQCRVNPPTLLLRHVNVARVDRFDDRMRRLVVDLRSVSDKRESEGRTVQPTLCAVPRISLTVPLSSYAHVSCLSATETRRTFASDLKRIVRAISKIWSKSMFPECFCAVSASPRREQYLDRLREPAGKATVRKDRADSGAASAFAPRGPSLRTHDVLLLLAVSRRLLERADDERRGRRHDRDRRLTVLDRQADRHACTPSDTSPITPRRRTQALPVARRFRDVLADLLRRETERADLGRQRRRRADLAARRAQVDDLDLVRVAARVSRAARPSERTDSLGAMATEIERRRRLSRVSAARPSEQGRAAS